MLPWASIFIAALLGISVPRLLPWLDQKRQQRLAHRLAPRKPIEIPVEDLKTDETPEELLSLVLEESSEENDTAPSIQEVDAEDVPETVQEEPIQDKKRAGDIWSTLFPQSTTLDPPFMVPMNQLTMEQMDYMYFHDNGHNSTQLYLNLLEKYSQLDISLEKLQSFHPVVVFPHVTLSAKQELSRPFYLVKNLTKFSEKTLEESTTLEGAHTTDPLLTYAVGKYNEKRDNLYDTELFEDTTTTIDGYSGQRNVHTGIDLYGPIGTPVYSFMPGKIAFVGYNAAPGDYGNVIVTEHVLGTEADPVTVWALFGHLSGKSIQDKAPGQALEQGDILGWMGGVSENGGWPSIHVHVQLSLIPPTTHDMPGVVSQQDREKALRDYPDPRLVLGWLYD